jgi:HAMP domain-containing protein
MGHACTRADFPRSPAPKDEHPVTAVLAVIAILLAILLIAWARVEVHGTADLETLAEESDGSASHSTILNGGKAAENEAASSRWATGFSH